MSAFRNMVVSTSRYSCKRIHGLTRRARVLQVRPNYFHHQTEYKTPSVCFPSHAHSDHLTGLEVSKARSVYSSAVVGETGVQTICRADRIIQSDTVWIVSALTPLRNQAYTLQGFPFKSRNQQRVARKNERLLESYKLCLRP